MCGLKCVKQEWDIDSKRRTFEALSGRRKLKVKQTDLNKAVRRATEEFTWVPWKYEKKGYFNWTQQMCSIQKTLGCKHNLAGFLEEEARSKLSKRICRWERLIY